MGKKVTVLSVLQGVLMINLEIRDLLKGRRSEPVLKPNVVVMGEQLIDNGDGTVTDKQAGLTWVKRQHTDLPGQFKGRMNFQAREAACAALNFANKKDWRQPTRKELNTRVDLKRFNPAVDTNMFPDTKPELYGTSDSCVWDKLCCWCVSFSYGNVIYNSKDFEFYVWPVRSSQ